MTGGRRDVEADIRAKLGRNARTEVRLLRASSDTTVDAAIDRLVGTAYGSPDWLRDRLRDAADLLGPEDAADDVEGQGARALLRRAVRRAADPIPPAPPKPFLPAGCASPRLEVQGASGEQMPRILAGS